MPPAVRAADVHEAVHRAGGGIQGHVRIRAGRDAPAVNGFPLKSAEVR